MTEKKKGGRRPGFTVKATGDVIPPALKHAATVGDSIATEGGDFAHSYLCSINCIQGELTKVQAIVERCSNAKDVPPHFETLLRSIHETGADIKRYKEDLGSRLETKDARFFREIADYLDAAKESRARGPIAPAYYLAACFVEFCECTQTRIREDYGKPWIDAYSSFRAASKREPFTPSAGEILNLLNEALPDSEVPDVRTASRIADWARAKRPAKK